MTAKEQTRLQILNSLLAEHMTLDQAATLMGVSPRHTRRILADYRETGAASLAHGHRGRKPANAIPEATKSRVVHLARTVYEGANHTHLSELLSEREGLDMGRTTLRRIVVNAGLSSPRRRRPPKHRVRRQRMPREGMLIQMDGSYHRGWARTDLSSRSCSPWTMPRAAWATPSFAIMRIPAVISCCCRDCFGTAAFLSPCTPTGTLSSNTVRNITPPGRQPSSAGPWRSWGHN